MNERTLSSALVGSLAACAASGIALAVGSRLAWLRGAHSWSATLALVLALVLAARVFARGGATRRVVLGGSVLVASLLAAFELGAVLPLDQRGWEAWLHIRDGATFFGFSWPSDPEGVPLGALLALHAALPLLALPVLWRRADARAALIPVGVALVLGALFPPLLGPAPIVGLAVSRPHWPFLWLVPLQSWFGARALLALPIGLAAGTALAWFARGAPRAARVAILAVAAIIFFGLTLFAL